ncbi:MAG: sigma-54-dependent Fis family transcriptional regulator, partial [Planctomycetota bacterium]
APGDPAPPAAPESEKGAPPPGAETEDARAGSADVGDPDGELWEPPADFAERVSRWTAVRLPGG